MTRRIAGGAGILLVLLMWVGGEVRAQPKNTPASETHFCAERSAARSFDRQGLALVYCASTPAATVPLAAAHATAAPMFYSAVPAAWIGAGLTQRPADAAAAYRLTLTQGLAFGLILGAKHVVGRPRPYVTLPLEARSDEYQSPTAVDARLSFPSGHAGLSSALVTSWSLSYPRWYVIAPGALWATGVALSRLHLGVHYPSDVIVGAVVGVGVALLVDQLRALITPPPLRASAGARGAPGIPLVLRLTL